MNEIIQATLRCQCATITCVKIEVDQNLPVFLYEQGYHVCVADLAGANGETEMFLHIVASLPLGDVYMRLHKGINLAAFDDIFIDVLRKEPKLALVIMNADALIACHLNLVLNIFSIFTLKTQRQKAMGIQSLVTTFLIGTGPNFVEKLPENSSPEIAAKVQPYVRTREQREKDKAEHFRKLREGTLPWQAHMTDEQRHHVEKMVESDTREQLTETLSDDED